jgi:hypothetical protein
VECPKFRPVRQEFCRIQLIIPNDPGYGGYSRHDRFALV